MRFIAQLADSARDLPLAALNALVSEAIDIVVHCSRIDGTVRVVEVIAVEDRQTSADSTSFTVTDLFSRSTPRSRLAWSGNLPIRAARALESGGYDVLGLMGARADPNPTTYPASL